MTLVVEHVGIISKKGKQAGRSESGGDWHLPRRFTVIPVWVRLKEEGAGGGENTLPRVSSVDRD